MPWGPPNPSALSTRQRQTGRDYPTVPCTGQPRIPSAALVGTAGFVLASAAYLLITPLLEASPGLLRELQGQSWNLVPGLTLLGAVTGWVAGSRRPR